MTTRSPSLAAQGPPAIAIEIGPSARSAGVPSSAWTTSVSSTARSGTSSSELLVEALDHLAQLELRRDLAQPAAVGLARASLADVDRHVDVVRQGRKLLRDAGVVGVLGEVLLALRAGDLVDVVEHRLQRAELLQQLGGGLVADPRNAGDVVGGVALEPDQVGHQLRGTP